MQEAGQAPEIAATFPWHPGSSRMNSFLKIVFVTGLLFAAVVFLPWMSPHVFGGVLALGFGLLGGLLALLLAVVVGGAALLGAVAVVLGVALLVLVVLSPVLLPVALVAGLIWLVTRLARGSTRASATVV